MQLSKLYEGWAIVLIRKKEVVKLSEDIRKIIDGQKIDLRDNQEGPWSILKNDIHTLANLKNEQMNTLKQEHEFMQETLANISHQLKTPLTSMMIMADLLEDAPPEKQKEFLLNIKKELDHTQWLATALLKMAKLDAGAINFSVKENSSKDLVDNAVKTLQILLEVKNQQVEISGETTLLCDEKWTTEVLTNVIKNASEHSPEGSTINVKVGSNPICKWIEITDKGIGISKTGAKHIFKRFEGTRSDKGYGIGLPLSLAIMKSQNGDIEVRSEGQGQGATFVLKFFR